MKKRFCIEIYKLGTPGIAVKIFELAFDSVLDAVVFAESIIADGEGFYIQDR